MVAFGHTAVGSLVGLAAYSVLQDQNPAMGLVTTGALAVVSHYITDFVPHGHYIPHQQFKQKVLYAVIFDFLLSFVLFMSLAYLSYGLNLKTLYILFGIGGANLPDVLDGLYYLKVIPNRGIFKIENRFHQSTHWHAVWKKGVLIDGLPLGKKDIWQLGMVCLVIVILFR